MTAYRTAALGLASLVFAFSTWVSDAQAEGQRVLLLHDGVEAPALADGLRVELAATSAEVHIGAAPVGATSLLRAGAAQSIARTSNAAFAIWVERQPTEGAGDLLRVVDPESDHIRDAPLPSPVGTVAPRTFAAVAASLIGELLDPAEPEPAPIRVHVLVETPNGDIEVEAVANTNAETATALGEPAEGLRPSQLEAPAMMIRGPISEMTPSEVTRGDGPIMPREGFTLSASLSTAFVATGGELSLGLYLSEFIRLDLFGQAVVHYIDDPAPAGTFGLALTRVGASRSARFDAGGFASLLIVGESRQSSTLVTMRRDETTGSTGGTIIHGGIVTGAHVGWTWELSRGFGLGFRLAGGVSFVADGWNATPFGMLSLRTEFAL